MAEIIKMKQGMSYSCKEKTIILNVFKYFRLTNPDLCVTEVVRRTAKATGCSEKSIFQFRKEEASAEGFREPSKTKIRKNVNINSRDVKYDSNVRQAIRNIIYDLKYRNVVPSLSMILKQVNTNSQLPNFSLMTLRRLMFDMGFYYEKNGNKSILTEKQVTKKENTSQKLPSKAKTLPNNNCNSNNNNVQNVCLINSAYKVVPTVNTVVQNNNSHPANHGHLVTDTCNIQQNHSRIMPPIHIAPSNNVMMPPMHAPPAPHDMSIMLNRGRDFIPPSHQPVNPSNMDMYLKRDMSNWIHPHMINGKSQ